MRPFQSLKAVLVVKTLIVTPKLEPEARRPKPQEQTLNLNGEPKPINRFLLVLASLRRFWIPPREASAPAGVFSEGCCSNGLGISLGSMTI